MPLADDDSDRSRSSCRVLPVAFEAEDLSARRRWGFFGAVSNMTPRFQAGPLPLARSSAVAWRWRDFDLDTPVAFAHKEHG
jgi:hypothetical protein